MCIQRIVTCIISENSIAVPVAVSYENRRKSAQSKLLKTDAVSRDMLFEAWHILLPIDFKFNIDIASNII